MASLDTFKNRILDTMLPDEGAVVSAMLSSPALTQSGQEKVSAHAAIMIERVRASRKPSTMEAFLNEYGLSTAEGVALMTLAEALLRVPDAFTIDDLISNKIGSGNWADHLGKASTSLVNTASWALNLTAGVLDQDTRNSTLRVLKSVVRRTGEPVIRSAVGVAMKRLGAQFVLGRTIDEALKNGDREVRAGYRYSFDMLGEAARTYEDAQTYFDAYGDAIDRLSSYCYSDDIRDNPGISVKLSALHPRYEWSHRDAVQEDMLPRVKDLALAAKEAKMGFNIDAEEADRLVLSLDIIEALMRDPDLGDWNGLGVVVQAYGPRASLVIDWLSCLAGEVGRPIMVRLVKGAYWDTEIKRAQIMGLKGFPVFTKKVHTDLNYLHCAKQLLDARGTIYPQFATHNAHTMAAVLEMAGDDMDSFEFQRLHGMGESLHAEVRDETGANCRIYAPVGAHRDLLAYLVRRLLENGANSSFVNQIVDKRIPPEEIARGPYALLSVHETQGPNRLITRPSDIFQPVRQNSLGWDWTDSRDIDLLEDRMAPFATKSYDIGPLVPFPFNASELECIAAHNPALSSDTLGTVMLADADLGQRAIGHARNVAASWNARPVEERAAVLMRAADLFEKHAGELLLLARREAGKTLMDAIGELREAVDFLRYYAAEAQRNEQQDACGVFACISPWNFPLAIFIGQISAALVTGNTVIAKPAEATPIIAYRAVELFYEAGAPKATVQLLPGYGAVIGALLCQSPHIDGICFTGSTATAQRINRAMAGLEPDSEGGNPTAHLIAETGGLNAMIVDSTALPEQAVRDIIASAFQSAGQRCSACRLVYVQEDIAESFVAMLSGAMDALSIGNPSFLSTDVGPVIDERARADIQAYCDTMRDRGAVLHALDLPPSTVSDGGTYVAPHLIAIEGIDAMDREIFGPVLHLATFKARELTTVIDRINAKGFGLTLGLHTRIDSRSTQVAAQANVGNIYINRNQIGAVVASQPFGGEGLSGTGPKAGGPLYLPRFTSQKTADKDLTIDPEADITDSFSADRMILEDVEAALISVHDLPLNIDMEDSLHPSHLLLRDISGSQFDRAHRLVFDTRSMPGPTGESNDLTFYPRGTLLAFGPDRAALLEMIGVALTTGNRVLAITGEEEGFLLSLIDAGFPVAGIKGHFSPEILSFLTGFDGVLWAGGSEGLGKIRAALALRDGALLPVLTPHCPPARYIIERHVCIDTTAAGGNASLLATSSND